MLDILGLLIFLAVAVLAHGRFRTIPADSIAAKTRLRLVVLLQLAGGAVFAYIESLSLHLPLGVVPLAWALMVATWVKFTRRAITIMTIYWVTVVFLGAVVVLVVIR